MKERRSEPKIEIERMIRVTKGKEKYLWICHGVRATNFVCFYLFIPWFVQFNMLYGMNLLVFGFELGNEYDRDKIHSHMQRMKQKKKKLKNEPMSRQWECKRFFAAFVSYQCIPSKLCCCCLHFNNRKKRESERDESERTYAHAAHNAIDVCWFGVWVCVCDYGYIY